MPLDELDMKRLDDRYVTKAECEAKSDKTQADIAEMRADMREMNIKVSALLKVVLTLGSAALVPLVGMAIKVIFGG